MSIDRSHKRPDLVVGLLHSDGKIAGIGTIYLIEFATLYDILKIIMSQPLTINGILRHETRKGADASPRQPPFP